MRFSDYRVTVEKRTAKAEKLTRMAQHVTLSTPRSVRPPASEPSETGGTRPNREVLHPMHNRASRRKARKGA